jgi:vacuolar-type H+-ATPase subunit H
MTFQNVLRQVLETERRGKRRLGEAREEAEKVLERARGEASRLRQEAQRRSAQEKEHRISLAREEIAVDVARTRELTEAEIHHLCTLAAKNRERTVRQVLAWLGEQR